MNRKGQGNPFSSGTGLVLALVVMVVVVVLGIVLLGRLQTSTTGNNPNLTEYAPINNSINGLSEITNLAPTFGVVIAIVIILALILGLFAAGKVKFD